MSNTFFQVQEFLRFMWSADTIYTAHSPFLFDFTTKVIENNRTYYAFSEIETLRKLLKSDQTNIALTDFGAGSQVVQDKKRSIGSITRHSATTPLFCRYLFHIIQQYKPQTLLELGTSVGISCLYQAAAATNAKFITIEGDPAVASVAAKNLQRFDFKHLELWQGRFSEKLLPALHTLQRLDYVFIDGNHRKDPTLAYFETCLTYAHTDSIFVFDDIHWSPGMNAAWEEIKRHPKVTCTIDLFSFGVIFFRPDFAEKTDVQLVKHRWKPWQKGFLK